ncbi:MAG TPA: molybdopterin-guanine dinucleotide biosynthesis protein B [Halomonas sp.]|nr:molybdopterin-guanine dinucleotide biosynthesis protein B [Halomonas sp.]
MSEPLHEPLHERLILDEHLPLLGIAAWSGTGKTTLLERLLPRLSEQGLRVAVIKHAHHGFDIDQPGKDSYRLREAGAVPMVVASRSRVALMMETPGLGEANLVELIAMVRQHSPDLVLVEGFKAWPLPKLELYRASLGKPLRAGEDPWIKAVASDQPLTLPDGVESLDLNDHDSLVAWIAAWPSRWSGQRGPRPVAREEAR